MSRAAFHQPPTHVAWVLCYSISNLFYLLYTLAAAKLVQVKRKTKYLLEFFRNAPNFCPQNKRKAVIVKQKMPIKPLL